MKKSNWTSQTSQSQGGYEETKKSSFPSASTFFFTTEKQFQIRIKKQVFKRVAAGNQMMRELRVLLVEDSEFDTELIRRALNRNFHVIELLRVDDSISLRQQLAAKVWDVVLSNYQLPGLSAQEALAFVRERDEYLPFLLVSSAIGEEKTVEILKFGADDIVLKNNLARLAYSIERVLREHRFRESEAQAKKTAEQAVRGREQMLTVVSHDLRNPLAAIQLNAETVRAKIENAKSLEEIQETLGHVMSIIRSSVRMKSLISDVLDKVRLESGGFSVHRSQRGVNEFLQEVSEVFAPLAAEKSIRFYLEEPQQCIEASLDFERLYQILSNLIGNAIKFTTHGGSVWLRTNLHEKDIEFCVTDTGPGIEDKDLDRIFEKYFQTTGSPRQGIGLGLTIAKDLVKAHGGRIWVESQKGKGTTFGFLIPCQWQELGTVEPAQEMHQPPRWICLVDDDDDLRDILEENLKSLGYLVSAFASGLTALNDLENRTQAPDLMILDYRLPDMNGGEVMKKMGPKLLEKKVPVIFLSAEANLSYLARKHNAAAFVAKPLRIKELSKVIQSLI